MSTPDQPVRRPKERIVLGLLLLLGFTNLAWSPTLKLSKWTADDPQVVLAHPVVTGALPAVAAFDRDYTHHIGDSGQWRPTSALSLRLDHILHGPESSRGWHLTNFTLHLLTVALAALLAYRARGTLLLLGVAMYAAHPLLTDSVAWISGRPSLLCALLGLIGAHLLQTALDHGRKRDPLVVPISASIALGLPLLAKEDGVLFALLFLLLAVPRGRLAIWRTAAGCVLTFALWLCARALALGVALPAAAHPLLAGVPLHERLIIGLRAAAEASRLAFAPVDFPPHYDLESLPGLPLSLTILILIAGLLFYLHRSRPIPAALILLPILAFLPFLQIFPSGEAFAPRFVHIPLLFSIPLADHLLRRLPRRLTPVLPLVLLALTWISIPVYADAESYWRKTLRHSPTSAVAWNALGLAFADDGRHEEALTAYHTALEHNPRHSRAWTNLARSLLATGRGEESVEALRRAVSTGPFNPVALVNWGRHLAQNERHAEARDSFYKATVLRPGFHQAWQGLARAEEALGRTAEARAALEQARSLHPD